MSATSDLDATISALQGGLTSIPPEAAVSNIESWQGQLQEAAPEIANLLGELKTALMTGSVTPESLSELLTDLGVETATVGESAGGEAGAKVEELGAMLSQAGASLG